MSVTDVSAKKLNVTDLIIGAIVILGGASVIVYALGMTRLNTGDLGPGLLPAVVGGGLVLAGTILLIQAVRGKVVVDEDEAPVLPEGEATESLEQGDAGAITVSDESPRRLALNAVTVVVSIVAYMLVSEWLGFILTMFLVLSVIQIVLGARWLQAVLVAIGTTVVLYLLFEKLLLVQLPNGLLGF